MFRQSRVVLIILAAVLVLGACPRPPATQIPEGFSVSWTSGPTHAERGGHRFMEVAKAKTGSWQLHQGVRYRFISKQDGQLRDKFDETRVTSLTDTQVLSLYQSILDEDIHGMDRQYRDQDIMDGSYRTLKVHWKGQDKVVTAVNTKPNAMMTIRNKLRELLGPD